MSRNKFARNYPFRANQVLELLLDVYHNMSSYF